MPALWSCYALDNFNMPAASITVLVENSVACPILKAEHGLAVWLETDSKHILFDAGQSDLLTDNAKKLAIDLSLIDTFVLSHGHYDHSGGLADALARAPANVNIHLHPKALEPKYRVKAPGTRDIGMPSYCRAVLRQRTDHVHTNAGPTEIASGVFLTGEIPRTHPEEQLDEGFRIDETGQHPDLIPDDQALFLQTPAGTIVLLGCAHAGVINTLEYIHHLTNKKPFHTVFGGMHLNAASIDRIAWTVESLRSLAIERLHPVHCTGTRAEAALWTAFPGRCFPGSVGTTINF